MDASSDDPSDSASEGRLVLVGSFAEHSPIIHSLINRALVAALSAAVTKCAIAAAQETALPEEFQIHSAAEAFGAPLPNWPGKNQPSWKGGGGKIKGTATFKPNRRGARGR